MGWCKNCGRGGIFYSLTKNGLCKACARRLFSEGNRRVKIINDTVAMINATKDVKRNLPRYEKVIANLEAFLEYERKGIQLTTRSQKSAMNEVLNERDFAISNWLSNEFNSAIAKSRVATTSSAKKNAILSFIKKSELMKANMTDTSEADKIEELAYQYLNELNNPPTTMGFA